VSAGPATIADVARAAEVSPATVSRVLNGTSAVSEARAARVRDAARRLGYRPFEPARALRRQRTRVWAAIIADIENPFFTAMVRGIEDVARSEGFRLVLCNSDEDLEKERSYIDVVIAERMAGVVIAVASTDDSSLQPLLDRGTPIVAVDRRPLDERVDSVVVDNRAGAAEATEHLLSNGWTRVACITGPKRVDTANQRLDGYRDAFRARGVPIVRSLVRRADYKEAGGYRAMSSLLESAEPPEAVFVANNPMAVGALRAISDHGRAAPDDIGLVAFDDSPWTTLTKPSLSVVAQPAYEIGQSAARLLSTAEGEHAARHIELSPTLIVRESSVSSRRIS
jgi:LacI family transcriptional regulator